LIVSDVSSSASALCNRRTIPSSPLLCEREQVAEKEAEGEVARQAEREGPWLAFAESFLVVVPPRRRWPFVSPGTIHWRNCRLLAAAGRL